MLLFLTYLVVAQLHVTQPTHVANLHQTQGYTVQLHQPVLQSIEQNSAQNTIYFLEPETRRG